MTQSTRAAILSTGAFVPEKVLTNHDLEKMVETSDDWIVTRTGIRERRMADPSQASSDLALPAARQALERAGLTAEDIDLIIVATISPDMNFPSTACWLQAGLGAKNAAAFDLSAACSGYIYSLMMGKNAIEAGTHRHVLVVGAEVLTKITDYTDRTSCILFGDGAGAVVLGASRGEHELQKVFMQSDGAGGDIMKLPAGGTRMPATHETVEQRMHYMKIRGREVYKFVVLKMADLIEQAARDHGIRKEDIALIVPHQMNSRIIEGAMERLALPMEKVYMNIDRYGNTSAASIPLALDEAIQNGRVHKGDYVCLVAFGAGLTWGYCMVRW